MSHQSPVMPSRSIGLLSSVGVSIKAQRKMMRHTFARRDQIVFVIVGYGGEAQMGHWSGMTVAGQWDDFGRFLTIVSGLHRLNRKNTNANLEPY